MDKQNEFSEWKKEILAEWRQKFENAEGYQNSYERALLNEVPIVLFLRARASDLWAPPRFFLDCNANAELLTPPRPIAVRKV